MPMHPFDWKLLKSDHLVKDRWLSLRADTCQLPNGHTIAPYYVLEYPTWVNVVALTPENHVVMVRQYRHGVGRTVVELPSGTVEASDPSPLAAMRRELLEETGYAAASLVETGRVSPNTANHTNWTHCFLATGVQLAALPQHDPTEEIETLLVPLNEVVAMARRGELHQALHVSSLFFTLDCLKQMRTE